MNSPTAFGRSLVVIGILGLLGVLVGSLTLWAPEKVQAASVGPAGQAQSLPSDTAIVATNSADLRKGAALTGDVVVNEISGAAVHLNVDDVDVIGDVKASIIDLAKKASVGNVCVDTLNDAGATINGTTGSYSTADAAPCEDTPPIFDPLPPFQAASAGTDDVVVPSNGTMTIGPDRYGDIIVDKGATLFITGGLIEAASLTMDANASLLFQAATDLRVAGRFNATKGDQIGPAAGSGISASEIIVYVGGFDDDGTLPDSAGVVGENGSAAANFYVPNGTFDLGKGSVMTGAVIAADVVLETNASLTVDSFFINQPPVADPQIVPTNGIDPVEITLTGTDPEGEDLAFSILPSNCPSVGPCKGTLGALTPIVPAPVEDRTTGKITQPPVTSATVIYTPDGNFGTTPGNSDNFTFEVTDVEGATGTAVVTVEIPDDSTEVTEITQVTPADVSVDTAIDTPVTIGLSAAACPDVTSLIFAIESLPMDGALSDSLGNSIESVPFDLPDNTVVYTPDSSFTGIDDFEHSAREDPANDCPSGPNATVSVGVFERFSLAGPDQTITTNVETPVQFTVVTNSGGSGDPVAPLSAGPTVLGTDIQLVAVAGGVADVPLEDGIGDVADEPPLVAAGVEVPGTGNPSGSVTDPTGDTANSGDPDLVSASVSIINGVFEVDIRYDSATFDPLATPGATGAFVYLDTDQNVATGCDIDEDALTCTPGASDDSVGWEYRIQIPKPQSGFDTNLIAQVTKFDDVDEFSDVPFTIESDGFTLEVPLANIGGDDGVLNFLVESFTHSGSQPSPSNATPNATGLDFAPDRNLDPGMTEFPLEGTVRLQIEFDISNLDNSPQGIEDIESAVVRLTTKKGPDDSADTEFFSDVGAPDGQLTPEDFETTQPGTSLIDGAVMTVPDVPDGTEGTFSFNVTNELKDRLIINGIYVLQGRLVNESNLTGFHQGLQVKTSGPDAPVLVVTTPDPIVLPTIEVTALPSTSEGTVRLLDGTTIVEVGDTFSGDTNMVFTPATGFTGLTSMQVEVTESGTFDTAIYEFDVTPIGSCLTNEAYCDDGRP